MCSQSWWGAELLATGADDAVWAVGRHEVTMGRLRGEVGWLARLFGHHGIGAGSTVALCGAPSFTQLWAILALWSLGSQVLLVDPRIGRNGLGPVLAECGPQFQVTFGGVGGRRVRFTDECEVMVARLRSGLPATTRHCLVQFSSGTSGRIKAIGRDAGSLRTELDRLRALPDMPGAGERVLLLESISHSFGLIGGVLHALDVGATVLFEPVLANDVVPAEVVIGTPRQFDRLVSAELPRALPGLRLAISGGEVLPGAVADGFAERFGVRIGQAYGTTETGVISADLAGRHGPAIVGPPLPGVRVRVVGGMLQVELGESPYLTEFRPSYDGWVSTQDQVSVDAATGALRLRGRLDGPVRGTDTDLDLVEIESVLRSHREVTDVVVVYVDTIEAHVAGSSALNQTELLSWCRRVLGAAKTPSRCRVLPELPRTASGKLVRDSARLWAHVTT